MLLYDEIDKKPRREHQATPFFAEIAERQPYRHLHPRAPLIFISLPFKEIYLVCRGPYQPTETIDASHKSVVSLFCNVTFACLIPRIE